MNRFGTLLQLSDLTWKTIPHQQLRGRIMTVLFAYGIVSWNRFGLLTFSSPRAPARVLLIGVYGWMAISLVIWLASRWGERGQAPLRHAAIAAAIAQVPVVALGFVMAIVAGFARILGPALVLAIFVFALWIPLLLLRAFRDVAELPTPVAAGATVITHLAWLALPGRYFYDQVGHLL